MLPSSRPAAEAAAPGGIRCADCGNTAATEGFAGFCRRCGAPLCFRCASNMMTSTDTRTTMIVPLVVATYSSNVTVTAKVPVCKSCRAGAPKEQWAELKRAGKVGLAVWLILSTIIVVATGIGGAVLVFAIIGVLSLMFTLMIYTFTGSEKEKYYGPCCPVCGRDAMPMLQRQAASMGVGEKEMPDILFCDCGYQGPRAPLDGLWLFVDRYGPGPLRGSPLEPLANASYAIRHSGGKGR